jgi:hypothetical protein
LNGPQLLLPLRDVHGLSLPESPRPRRVCPTVLCPEDLHAQQCYSDERCDTRRSARVRPPAAGSCPEGTRLMGVPLSG